MQSRIFSFIESITNVTIGYTMAIFTQLIVFPLFNIEIDLSSNFIIALIFTIVSLARSYVVRRLFNKIKIQGN